MGTKFTAEDARKATKTIETIEDIVDNALNQIRTFCENPKNSGQVSMGLHGETKGGFSWAYDGYNETLLWKSVKKELEELGYQVSFFYQEMQFVNMYTKISWEKNTNKK